MYRVAMQKGFSLLEVLVALLILSVGLIGLAGLQLTGVQNGRDAYYRSQAIVLAYDIADRMRANQQGVEDGDYHLNAGTLTAACRTSAGCSASQLAGDDVALWRNSVANVLPDGDAVVCVDIAVDPDTGTSFGSPGCSTVNAGNTYAAKLWWGDGRSLVLSFVPR